MFKFSFLPKENKFNELLKDLAGQAALCAAHLKNFVETGDTVAADAITTARNEAKRTATDMTRQLCMTFVTPFDREDIQDIADNLYRIPKTIEKVKERLQMHDMGDKRDDFLPQIELIVLEAEAMESMVADLVSGKHGQKVQEKVALFYDLENKGDIILGELLKSLFNRNHDARELILRKDIYDMLEKIIDRYRDTAGVALQMVLKHT